MGVVVITGAGRGLGRKLGHYAASQGLPIALLARTRSNLEQLREELKESTVPISTHAVDLASTEQTNEAFNEISKIHRNIRVLVNNAGTWTGGVSVESLSREKIQESFDLNFFSAFNATKACLSHWNNTDLSIINVGATASLRGAANMSAFAMAKSALRIFSQSLAKELGPQGIHVAHFIIDGLIDNERTRKLNPERAEDRFIQMESLAKEILHIAFQARDCWTFEWDVRTHNSHW